MDTEGLPELFRKNISGHVLGKTLVDLVHPHDRPLIKEHIEGVLSTTTDTSRVYRMVLPPPQNVVHVKTKTKDFRPQGGSSHPGYVMSTHAIIRENELMIEDLPALRPELRGLEGGGEGDQGSPPPPRPDQRCSRNSCHRPRSVRVSLARSTACPPMEAVVTSC